MSGDSKRIIPEAELVFFLHVTAKSQMETVPWFTGGKTLEGLDKCGSTSSFAKAKLLVSLGHLFIQLFEYPIYPRRFANKLLINITMPTPN